MSPTPDEALARVYDVELFTAPYFTIDAQNRLSSGMLSQRPTDRQAVTVGTVRADVVAVDIDLDDADAAAWLVHHLTQWCEDHVSWHLHRSSGGGPGRSHFYAIPPAHAAAQLRELVAELRQALGARSQSVDLRSTLRLLSSPHRLGGARGPLFVSELPLPSRRDPQGHPKALSRVPRAADVPPTNAQLTASQRATARMVPASRRPRHGRVPAGVDRSETEYKIARRLKAQGASPEAVYNALRDTELRADLGKSAERGYAWFQRHIWSRITVAPRPENGSRGRRGEYDWARYALPTSAAVRAVWHQWCTRQRHSVEHVAVVAAARLGPLGQEGGPLPLRDLVEDTGRDLGTIRSALKALCDAGILRRTRRFTLSKNADKSSDHYALIIAAESKASLTPTPRSYTPADPLWLGLAPSAPSLTLTLLHSPTEPLDLASMLRLSGFTFSRRPSTRQRTLGQEVLACLVQRAVLSKTSDGYREGTKASIVRPREGLRRWSELRERHRVERGRFRQWVKDLYVSAQARWQQARQESLERLKQRNRERQIQWWRNLSEGEREHRWQVWKETWAGASPEARRARARKLAAARPGGSDWSLAA